MEKGIKNKPWATWNMAKKMARMETPVAQFYRGITANGLASGATWGLLWMFKGRFEELIRARKPNPTSSAHVELTKSDTFLATAAASIAIQIVSNPIWVVKTRMLAHARGDGPAAYPTTMAAIKTIYRVEGFHTFYSGFWISAGGILQGSVQMTCYDHIGKEVRRRRRVEHDIVEGSDADRLSVADTTLVSCAAKIVAVVTTYPYQVIRSRLQMKNAEALYGKGIRGVSGALFREGRYRAFYKGLGPAVVRNLPATCITFLVYENMWPTLTEVFGGAKSDGRTTP